MPCPWPACKVSGGCCWLRLLRLLVGVLINYMYCGLSATQVVGLGSFLLVLSSADINTTPAFQTPHTHHHQEIQREATLFSHRPSCEDHLNSYLVGVFHIEIFKKKWDNLHKMHTVHVNLIL